MSLPITANGAHVVSVFPGFPYLVAASGDFGGGSLALEWLDEDGDATPLDISPATIGFAKKSESPSSRIRATLSGATAPDIELVISLTNTNPHSEMGLAQAVMITHADYLALTAEQQNDPSKFYFIFNQ